MSGGRYFRKWLEERVTPLFGERDRDAVINWLATHRGRPKVVVIGSGFSRNAQLAQGQVGDKQKRVPLWSDITRLLRSRLGYFDDGMGPHDPLLVAEQFQEALGREKFSETLLEALRDQELVPGAPHNALYKQNIEAIITTNQLDTLLDRMHGAWFRVVTNTDLPIARARSERSPTGTARQIIYLHGHRDDPTSWVFSRSEYEALERERPAVVRRVQQLLSEYPLLVLGYSLSDPDFHSLFGRVYDEQSGYMPRALCITVGNPPLEGERAHWRRLGMHLAHLLPDSELARHGIVTSQALESVILLDDAKPDPEYVVDSIESIGGFTLELTLRSRLEEFESIFKELEDLVLAPSELTQLHFEAWATCLPTFASHRLDTDIDITLPTPPGSLESDESFTWQDKRRSLDQLPHSFEDMMSGRARALLLAIDTYLSRGGSRSSVSAWLDVAKYRRLRAAEQIGLGEPIQLALNQLFLHFETLDHSVASRATAEVAMQSAYSTVLAGEHLEAASRYEAAAVEFAGRGDASGEWYARVSKRISLQVAAQFPAVASSISAMIQQEQAAVHRLERSRSVVNEVERRSRTLAQGYRNLVDGLSKEPSPSSFSYNISSIPSDVFQRVQEDQFLGVAPQLTQELAALWVRLVDDEEPETVGVGLRYFAHDLPKILGRERGREVTSQASQDDELAARLLLYLEPSHPLSNAAHLCPAISAVLGHIATRLTSSHLESFVYWLERERAKASAAFVHAFGATSTSNIDRVFVSLALNSLPNDRDDGWTVLKRYAANNDIFGDPALWQGLVGSGWGVLLARTPSHFNEIVAWHAQHRPSDDRSQQLWLQSLGNLFRTGKELALPLPDEDRDSFLALAREEAHRGRVFLGLIEAIDGKNAVIPFLRAPSERWSVSERHQAAANLVEAGEESAIDLADAFNAELKDAVQAATETSPRNDLYELEQPFHLIATCLSLQVGDRTKQLAWLHRMIAQFERAPLFVLSHAIRLGRWSQGEETSQFVDAIFACASPIRRYHLLRLGHFLCDSLRGATMGTLGPDFFREIASLAVRSVDESNRQTVTTAVNCLISILNESEAIGLPQEFKVYLIAALRRCAEDRRSAVRATVALRMGELSFSAPQGEFRKLAEDMVNGTASAKGLLFDHSVYVSGFANYGQQKGMQNSRTLENGDI